MATSNPAENAYTLTEAISIAFTICYCILATLLTLLLLVFIVALAHVILHRAWHGHFPSFRTSSTSTTSPPPPPPPPRRPKAEPSLSSSETAATTAPASKTSANNSAKATDSTPAALVLATGLNAIVLFIIPFMIMNVRVTERKKQRVVDVQPDLGEMGRDFLFGVVPGSMVLAVFVVVEIAVMKGWRAFDTWVQRDVDERDARAGKDD